MEGASKFYDCNNTRVCSHFRIVYFYSDCQISIHSNADSIVFVNNFIDKVVNLAFLDTRYIIKIFIHALLVKSELNCC